MSKHSLLEEYKNELSFELDQAIEENTMKSTQSFVLQSKSSPSLTSSKSQKNMKTEHSFHGTSSDDLFVPNSDITENWTSKERKVKIKKTKTERNSK
jgi:hypothetical protein